MCYQQDSYWAQCRPEGDIPDNWKLLTHASTSPPAQNSPIVEASPEESQNSGSGGGAIPGSYVYPSLGH